MQRCEVYILCFSLRLCVFALNIISPKPNRESRFAQLRQMIVEKMSAIFKTITVRVRIFSDLAINSFKMFDRAEFVLVAVNE